jgi:hypothetical protein
MELVAVVLAVVLPLERLVLLVAMLTDLVIQI